MRMAPIQTPEQKLVELQNDLAEITDADIVDVRRAFNNANDAQYYSDKFDRTKVQLGYAAVFGVFAGVGTIAGIASSSMPVAICFAAATFGMQAWARASVRSQKAVREEIKQKVAAAPKAPEV